MLEFKYRMAKMSKNTHFDRPFNLLNSVKSKCKIIKTWRLHHQLALEQYFILLMDFRSIIELEVAEFVVQNCPIYKKNPPFLRLVPQSLKKIGGSYRSKNFLPSARAAKTLQFGHQFHADWFIQSQEILKLVKNVIFAIEIEAAI